MDIELKKSQDQLFISKKMDAIGQLTGGIAFLQDVPFFRAHDLISNVKEVYVKTVRIKSLGFLFLWMAFLIMPSGAQDSSDKKKKEAFTLDANIGFVNYMGMIKPGKWVPVWAIVEAKAADLSGVLTVADIANGTLDITSGAAVSNTDGYLGYYGGSAGAVTVNSAVLAIVPPCWYAPSIWNVAASTFGYQPWFLNCCNTVFVRVWRKLTAMLKLAALVTDGMG